MKKFLYFLLAIVTLASFGCTGDSSTFMSSVGTPNPTKFTPKGTVSGVLVDVCTNSPIANADVYILDKKATTSTQGMFTIKNVPANTAVGNEPDNTALGLPLGSGTSLLSNGLHSWDTYNVVIDMSRVNKEIADYNANPKNTVKKKYYPGFAYHTVKVSYTSLGETSDQDGSATNHDTPVDGFVANIKPMVGKLAADLNIQVVRDYDAVPVGLGCVVELISISPLDGFADSNNATGNLANVVATANTDVNGIAKFANVESAHLYYAKATTTIGGKVWTGHQIVFTQCDGTTTNFYLVGPNPAMTVSDASESVDDIKPFIASVTPANLADIAPSDTQQVVFTFSEVLKPTQYLKNTTVETDTGAGSGVYADIKVNYLGPKAGNIPYTLSWDSLTAPKVLTVTFATAKSSKYTVDMSVVVPKLLDLNDNPGTIIDHIKDVSFTTNGGLEVAAPTVVPFGATNETRIDWTPMPNAVKYNVYIARSIDGVTSSYLYAGTTSFTSYSIQDSDLFNVGGAFYNDGKNTPNSLIPFNNGETRYTYSVYVVTVNSDNVESLPSGSVPIWDRTAPVLFAQAITDPTGGANIAPGATATFTNGLNITFNEVMSKASCLNAANYTAVLTGSVSNNLTFAVDAASIVVTYDTVNQRTNVVANYTIKNTDTNPQNVATAVFSTTAKDLAGNDFNSNPVVSY